MIFVEVCGLDPNKSQQYYRELREDLVSAVTEAEFMRRAGYKEEQDVNISFPTELLNPAPETILGIKVSLLSSKLEDPQERTQLGRLLKKTLRAKLHECGQFNILAYVVVCEVHKSDIIIGASD